MSREQSRSGAARGGKRILYLNRRAPHGSIYAHEALEALLMAAGFEQVPSVVFMDDGVYQLKLDQSPRALDMKNFAAAFRVARALRYRAAVRGAVNRCRQED